MHHLRSGIYLFFLFTCVILSGQTLSLLDSVLPTDDIDLLSEFGSSIAVDGNVAVVGMPFSGEYDYRSGQAFVYEKSAGNWALVAELQSPNPHINAYFGSDVAIQGEIIVVSARNQDVTSLGEGALFVYERTGSGWDMHTQVATLTSSEPQSRAGLGESVSIDGDVIIASSLYFDSLSVNDAGRVLVFEEPMSGWTDMNQTANLYSSIPTPYGSQFGYEVTISGDTVAVGAHYSYVGDADYGIVFLFYNDEGTSWESGDESAYLVGPSTDYQFGRSIVLAENQLFIGTRSSGGNFNGPPHVYVYEGTTSFDLVADLSPSDYVLNSSIPNVSLHYDGESVYQGIHSFIANGNSRGAVVRYTKPLTGWESSSSDATYISESDFFETEEFGTSVAGNNTDLLIGNPGNQRNGLSGGAVHVIDKSTGDQTSEFLEVSTNSHYHQFGRKVAISGNYALVFRNKYSPYGARGAVDVLMRGAATWDKIGSISPDEASFTSFGGDFDIQGTQIAISGNKENRVGVVRLYQIVGNAVDTDDYVEIQPSTSVDLEFFGTSLSLDPYSLVVGGYETFDGKKISIQLFVFEKENLNSTTYEQTSILTYTFAKPTNQFFKGIHHNRDRIVLTSIDSAYPWIVNFEKEGSNWDNATLRVIENPESSISDTNFNTFGTSGYLNKDLYITHDGFGTTTNLYAFDLGEVSVSEALSTSSDFESFGANFRGSGTLGISGNLTETFLRSDEVVAFNINDDGSLDSLYALSNPDADTESNFGGQLAIYGTNALIAAPDEDNTKGFLGGALYAYTTNQAYVTSVASSQTGIFGPTESIQITLTFSEAVDVAGVPYFELNLEEGAVGLAQYQSGTGTNQLLFNYTVSGGDNSNVLDYLEDGLYLPSGASIRSVVGGIDANTVLPPIGSGLSISGSTLIQIDANEPEITFGNERTKYNGSFQLPISFNKEVTGLEISDFVASNAIVSEVTGSGTSFTLSVEPIEEGNFSIYLAQGAVVDQYSQVNNQSEILELVYETIAPEYIISTNSLVTTSNIVELTFESTEDASVLVDELTLDNLLNISYLNEGSTHTLKFLVKQKNMPASCLFNMGSLIDEAGNSNTYEHTLEVIYDSDPPVISVVDNPQYLNVGENVLTLAFSEEITDVIFNKINVSHADFALGKGDQYQMFLVPTGSSSTITVEFEAGACTDLSGNSSERVVFTYMFDAFPPEIIYTLNESSAEFLKVYIEFTEQVTEVSKDDFSTVGVDSVGLTRYVDDSYLLYLRPDDISNVSVSLKPNLVADEAGNFVLFSEFTHITTGLSQDSNVYDLRWDDKQNQITLQLKNKADAQVFIFDLHGKNLYQSTMTNSKVIDLVNAPNVFILMLQVDESIYTTKLLNK